MSQRRGPVAGKTQPSTICEERTLAASRRRVWLPPVSVAPALSLGMIPYLRKLATSRRHRGSTPLLGEGGDRARDVVEALEEAVVLQHADGRTELMNASARELLSAEAGALTRLAPGWEMLDDDGVPLAYADSPVPKALATGDAGSQVVGLKRPDGSRRWMTVRARPLVRPGEERPHAVVSTFTDVTEQRELELHLTQLAQRDPLTGLWNRRRFEDDLAKQLARCRRYGERAALLVLDIDGFKQVNDTLGHLAGDEVLRALADGVNLRLRVSDSAARIGGDEFAVLLVHVDEREAREMATKVAARLSKLARDQLQADIDLSLSIGVALLDDHAGDVEDVLAVADRAMYADKRRHGRSPAGDHGARTIKVTHEPGPAGDAALRALLATVQERDCYAPRHSRQVVTLARAVARQLGLDERQVDEVENVALLHDLGKVAVPDDILHKPGPLTGVEKLLMRQHPVVGAQMVSSISQLGYLAPAIRGEHERWDGEGYPDGLAGEEIPLSSRIAFVCDAYHAMTSDRPYRLALSPEAAIEQITLEAGHQFCPEAVGALLEVLRAQTTELQDA